MAMDNLYSFGNVVFSWNVNPLNSVRHSHKFNWSREQGAAKYGYSQFTGVGENKITLSGRMYHDLGGRSIQQFIKDMIAIGESGEPQNLINGRGEKIAKYYLETFDYEEIEFENNAIPLEIPFTINLERYDNERV